MIERTLKEICFSEEFGRQMRVVTGPRQTGKTTLARAYLKETGFERFYFNWDKRETRLSYRSNPSFFMEEVYALKKKTKGHPWICFDEIHKMPKWKNMLKGIFDSYEEQCQFVITGSAKLDMLKYTGESLLGRYFTFRLFPIRLAEMSHRSSSVDTIPLKATELIEHCLSGKKSYRPQFEQLLNITGFPEPLLKDSPRFLQKWRSDYLEHFIKEDLRDLTKIADIEHVFQLMELIPAKVGNPLSLNALREDLEVSYNAVKNWLRALTLTYVVTTIKPFTKKIKRGIKKEKKCYLFDWGQVKEPSSRFENYTAIELLSFCNLLTDAGIGKYELFFVRTKDGKESDFLITQDGDPWILFECKL
ncbi:MAG: ATP-binding protein, partial [Desulfobacteraceae bacterium]|nr:ATP-binding protein [Desulfobacteraceae bacterium]